MYTGTSRKSLRLIKEAKLVDIEIERIAQLTDCELTHILGVLEQTPMIKIEYLECIKMLFTSNEWWTIKTFKAKKPERDIQGHDILNQHTSKLTRKIYRLFHFIVHETLERQFLGTWGNNE